ncbi:uncharacterized protein LOC34619282 [Cyclospora cayetanensis]|uniref:Uncharacterized protein LOC34619282 n=1 Tax=Cyclospora cayetanensis TaxID=88456 RepID=A0A6P6RR98_9EIME|nr:uncharacterized protein LOC34619282 [Cyclospora cayetanensis]
MEGGAAGGPGHCAFQLWVGNVPFDASEVELKNVLSVAGRVLGVRVKYDAESGQSKGFGFVDFPDLESCLLLLQQQQQQPIELRGRKLKLDWATAELREAYGSGTNAIGVAGGRQTKEAKWSRAASRPEISGGKTRVIGLSGAATAGLSGSRAASGGAAAAAAASLMGYSPSDPFAAAPGVLPSFVCEFMQCLSTSHLLQLLHHMQQLAQQHPHGCRRFLTDNPSLTYALLFAMYLVGAVSSKDLTTAESEMQQHTQQQQPQQQLQMAVTFDALKRLPEFERKQLQRNREERQQQLKAASVLPTRVEPAAAATATAATSPATAAAATATAATQQQPQAKPSLLSQIPVSTPAASGSVATDLTHGASAATAGNINAQAQKRWPLVSPAGSLAQPGVLGAPAAAKGAGGAPEGALLAQSASAAAAPPSARPPPAALRTESASGGLPSTAAAAAAPAHEAASADVSPAGGQGISQGASMRQWAAAPKASTPPVSLLPTARAGASSVQGASSSPSGGLPGELWRFLSLATLCAANRPQPNHPAWEVPPAAANLVGTLSVENLACHGAYCTRSSLDRSSLSGTAPFCWHSPVGDEWCCCCSAACGPVVSVLRWAQPGRCWGARLHQRVVECCYFGAGSTTAGVPSGHVARRNTSEATLYIEGIKGLLFYSVLRAEAGTRVAAVLLQDMQNATDVKPNALCV